MNFPGNFHQSVSAEKFDFHVRDDQVSSGGRDKVIVPDAHLLFSGEYERSGTDLIISDHDHRTVVHDYFRGQQRPALVSSEGATVDPRIIDALTGHIDYAQAAGTSPAGKVVGHVAKLAGSASIVRNGVTVELNNGDAVYQNDVVQTGSGSTVGLVMIDGTTFNLAANARLMLNDLTYDASSTSNTSLFSLLEGAASFVAGQVAKTGDMKVGTPVATVGIRGTAMNLDISSTDGNLHLSVIDQRDNQIHTVQIYNLNGDLIGTARSDGPALTLTPIAGLNVSVQEVSKSPADLALEFSTFQQVISTYDTFKAIAPNTPPPSDGKRGDVTPQSTTKFAGSSVLPTVAPSTSVLPDTSSPKAQLAALSSPDITTLVSNQSSSSPVTAPPVQTPNTSAPLLILTDTATPVVIAITSSGGPTNQPNQIITGTVDAADAGDNVTILDGNAAIGSGVVQPNGGFSVPVTLTNGSNPLIARVNDAAGNTVTSSAVVFTLSTTPPTVTEALTIETGSSASGHITSNDALSGTGLANTVVHFTIDGTAIATTVTADATGTWSFTPTGLADGAHAIVASQTDAFGNTGTASLSFTLDTTAPVVAIGSSGGATNQAAQTITGTVDVADAGETVTLLDGTTVIGTAVVQPNGSWSIPVTLSSGSNVLTAQVSDAAGNSATSSAVVYTLSTTAPSGGTPALAPASDSGVSQTDDITDATAPSFTVALSSTVVAGDTVQLLLGGLALAHPVTHTITAADISAGSVSLTVTAGDLGADGTKSITAQFSDAAGNTSTTLADVFTLDTTAPVVAITSAGGATNQAAQTITGTIAGADAGTTIAIFDGATQIGVATISGGSWSADVTLGNGSNSLTAQVSDLAGNTATSGAVTYTLSTTAPTVTEALSIDTGTSSSDHITSNDALSGTGLANTVVHFSIDGSAIATTVTTDAQGVWAFTPSGLADGAHTIVASQTDSFGNTGTAALSFTLDTTAPVVAITSAGGATNQAAQTITGTIAGADAGTTIAIFDGATQIGVATISGGSWSADVTLGNGSNSLTAQVSDLAGNTATSGAVTYTLSTTAPTVTEALSIDTGTSSSDHITSNDALSGTGLANTVVHFSIDGSAIATTVTTDAQGVWAFTPSGLADGAHTIVASQTDSFGNTGTAALSFTLDTTAPVVAITSAGGATNQAAQTITGTIAGADAGTTIAIFDGATQIGVATISGGSWSADVTLGNGSNSLTAQVSDLAGNTATSGAVTYTLSTTAPTVTEALSIDTGTSSSDHITSNDALSGTGLANTVVHFSIDGSAIATTVTTDAQGVWAFTPSGLADGAHTIVASQTDSFGNTGTAALSFTLDTTAPVVAITSAGGATNQAAQTITGTIAGADAGTTIAIFDGATQIGVATISGGSWSADVTLGNGSNSLTAQVSDLAGNTATSGAVTYTLSTTAPTVTEALSIDTGTSSSDHITSNDALSGTGLANTVVHFSIDGSAIATTVTTDAQGVWAFTPSGLADGAHTIVASQTDSFGNTGTAALSFTLDTTAPVVAITSAGGATNQAAQTITGTIAGADAGTTIAIFDGATQIGVATISGGSWSADVTLGNGSNSLTAQVSDLAGNTATSGAVTYTLSTTAPTVTEALSIDTGTSSSDHITSNDALSGTGLANTVVHFSIDGSAIATTVTTDAQGVWAFTPSGLADGAHTIVASQTDSFGNTGTAALSFTLDTTAPVVAITSAGGATNQAAQTITGTIAGADAGTTIAIFDGATQIGVATISGGSWSADVTLGNGSNSLTAQVSDLAGNTATSGAVTYTLSTTAPTVTEALSIDTGTSSSDHITSNDALSGTGLANTVVHFSIDGSAIATTVTTDAQGVWAFTPSGLADGAHTIVASQTDSFGNTGTAALSFTLDTTAPVVAITSAGGATNQAAQTITGTIAGADAGTTIAIFDGATQIGVATISGGSWSADVTLGNGSNSLTAQVSDLAGNTATSGAVTYTLSTTAPTVTEALSIDTGTSSSDHITSNDALSGTGLANTVVHFSIDGSAIATTVTTDAQGVWAFTPSGLADGAHTIVASQTDSFGNTGTAALSFTLDTTAPVVAITSAGGATNQAAQTITGTIAGADAGTTIAIFDGATQIGVATISGGSWSADVTLGNGSNSLTAQVSDLAGNTATSGAVTYTLSTTAPTVTEALSIDTGTSSSDHITSNDALSGTGLANTVVHFSIDGSAIATTVTTDAQGVWAFTPSGLADGAHTIVASQTDSFGNTGTAALSFTLDTTAPVVAITSAGGATNQAAQTITGTIAGADAGTTIAIFDGATQIGVATISGGSWSADVTLGNGSNSLTAQVSDLAGNTATSGAVTYTLSTTAPTVTEALSIDTGTSSSDHITSNDALSGTGLANTVVHFSIDGSAIATTVTTDAQGVWAFTPSGLADGAHTIVASQTDSFGNTGTAALSFTLDTTAPVVAITSAGGATNQAAQTITGTIAGADAGTTIAIFDGATQIGVATISGGSWSADVTLGNGSNSLTAQVSDLAGNTATSGAVTYTLSTTAPTVTEALSIDTGTSSSDHITSNDALSGTGLANTVVHFSIDGSAIATTVTTDAQGVWAFTPSGLADGAHTIVASQTDSFGNTGTAALSFTLDTTAPVVAITSAGGATNQAAQTITGTIAGADAGTTIAIFDGATQIGVATISGGSWSADVTLGNGSNSLTAQVSDLAGNTATSGAVTYTLSTTAPTVTEALSIDTGTSSSDHITSNDALSGTGLANTVVHFSIDGSAIATTVTTDAQGVWAFTPSGLADGAHTIVASQTDSFGNTGTAALSFTLDTTAPVVAITSAGGATNQAAQTITGTIAGADAGTTIAIFDGATQIGVATISGGSWSADVTLGNGSNSLTAQVSDLAGNTATSGAVTYTLSTTAPTVTEALSIDTGTSSSDHITSNDALSGTGLANTVVHFSIDGSAIATTVTTDAQGVWAFTPSGLADGAHTIVASQTDSFGNTGTAALSFTLDTTAPVVAITSAGGATNQAAQTITGTIAGADAGTTIAIFDGATQIGVATISGGSWSADVTLGNGSNSLTAQVSDLAGNTATSGAVTYTLSTTAPTVTEALSIDTGTSSSDHITSNDALSGTGLANTVVHFSIDGSAIATTVTTDAQGVWAFTPSGLADGAHTIVASQTDSFGNTGTAALSFTLDTTAPVVAITSAGGATNQAAQTITGTIAGADAGTTIAIFDGATQIGVATISGGSWSADVTLGNGSNSLTAQVSDLAGNTATSGAVTYTLSTTAPTVTEALSIDTGTSSSDHITSNDALSGTGLANTVVHFSIDGSAIATTVTTDAQGVWAFTPSGLADGAHTIVASQTDSFGNTGTAALSFTLDTTAPVVAITSAGGATNQAAQTITGTIAGADAGTTIAIFDGATQIGVATISGGSWSADVTLGNGSNSLTAQVSDLAGNTATSGAVTYTLSTTAPTVTEALSIDTGTSSSDHITSNDALSGTGLANTVVHFSIDGSAIATTVTTDAQGVWAFTPSGLADGAHTIVASQTDSFGNTGTAALSFTLDTTAPVVAITSAGGATNQAAQTITGTIAGADAGTTIAIFDGATQIGVATISGGSWSADVTLGNGSNSLTAQVSDLAGNTATSGAVTYTLSTQEFTIQWINPNSGDWNVPSNWSMGVLPGAADDVFVGLPVNITFSSGSSAVDELNSIAGASFIISGGSLAVANASAIAGTASISIGTLTLNGQTTIGSLAETGGLLNGTGTLTVSGLSTLSAGTESGAGTTIAAGGAAFNTTSFSLDGGRTLQLGGISTATGTSVEIDLNGGTDPGSGTLAIASGATFNDQSTGNGLRIVASNEGSTDTGATAVVNNQGIFTKSGSAATSTISTIFNNSGAVNVQSGTLNLSGNGTDVDGSYTGAGTIQFSGTTRTLDAASSIAATNAIFSAGTTTINGSFSDPGMITVNGGTLGLPVALTVGSLTESAGLLNGTGTLTVSGLSILSGGRESGAGTTIAAGGAAFSLTGFSLDGGRTLQLGSTSTATGTSVQIDLNGGTDPGSGILTIGSGATFNDQSTGNGLRILASNEGSTDTGTTAVVNNQGTFTKSGSAATSTISTSFNNSGTVNVQSGTLSLTGGGTDSGTFNISSSASVLFSSAFTLNGASSTGLGQVQLASSTLTVASASSFASGFVQSGGLLNGTGTLTVSGLSTLSAGTESGAGTTIAAGGAAFNTTSFSLDGGRTLQLGGISTATGTSVEIDLNGGTDPGSGTLAIASGATFNDQSTGNGLRIVASNEGSTDTGATAVVNNQGIFTKSGSAATSTISTIFNNSGAVNVQSGTLNLSGNGTDVDGSYTGAGTIQFSGTTRTLDAASSIAATNAIFSAGTTTINGSFSDPGMITVNGGTLGLPVALTVGSLTESAGLLNGTGTLTVSGLSILSGGRESGAGTTIAAGGAAFSLTGFSLDGGRTLQLGSTSTATGTSVQIDLNGGTDPGSGILTIGSGATFNDQSTGNGLRILASNEGSTDTGTTAVVNNQGTFTKSGSAATSTISTSFNNSGTVNVQSGTLSLTGGGTDSGTFNISSSASVLFSSAFTLNGASSTGLGQVQLASSTLTVASASSFASGFVQSGGLLNGTGTLTVSGLSTLSAGTESGAGTTIAAGGAAFNTTSFSLDGGRTLQLGGISTATGTSVEIDLNGGTDPGSGTLAIASGATFNDQSTGNGLRIVASNEGSTDTGATAVVNNQGIFTKSGSAATSTISTIFNNSGAVNVQSGTLNLSGNGTDVDGSYTGAGTIQFSGTTRTLDAASSIAATNAIFSAGTTTINGSFSDPGMITVNGGTLGLPVALTVGSLTESAGLLNGTGTLTVSGLSILSGGRESGAGTTIAAGGAAFSLTGFSLDGGRTLQLGSTSTATGTSVQIDLNGGTDPGSGILTIGSGATFNDQSTGNGLRILASNEGSTDTGTTAVVNNQGTFTKSGSAATSTISTSFNNSGTVNVQSGTLSLSGGGTLSGVFNIASGATAQFSGSTPFVLSGIAAFIGGALSGNGTLSIANGAQVEVSSSIAVGGPTVSFSSGIGTLTLDNPSTFHSLISGLAVGDTINFLDTNVSSATISANGSTLTVGTSSGQLSYQISGATTANSFAIVSSGATGSEIVLLPGAPGTSDLISGSKAAGTLSFAPTSAQLYQLVGANISGSGGTGFFVNSSDTNPLDSIFVEIDQTSSISVTGTGFDGVQIITSGASVFVFNAAPINVAREGINVVNQGSGNITINSGSIIAGSTGIAADNDSTTIPVSANSFISISASGSITAGTTLMGNGSAPDGIWAGYGNSTSPLPNANGTLVVNNGANITAPAQFGIDAFNFANGNVTVNDLAGTIVSGGLHGIGAFAESGGAGNIAINVGSGATIEAGTGDGIRAVSKDTGNISITTAPGDLVAGPGGTGSTGSVGIDAVNELAAIPLAAASSIVVTAYGTINSGSTATGTGSPPGGILAGYLGGTSNPTTFPLTALNGDVVVNNFANINAAAGDGIRAYNYGIGDVTVDDNTFGTGTDSQGKIVALGGSTPTNGYGNGIAAYDFGTGNISVSTGPGITIQSGSSGIIAVNEALATPSNGSVSVVAYGTITPGTIPTGNGNPPAGILAGFNFNTSPDGNVAGSVTIDDHATINAVPGGAQDGIRGFNYGTGDIAITAEAGVDIAGGRYGIGAVGHDGGNAAVYNSATVNGGSAGIFAQTTGAGAISIINSSTGTIESSGAPSSADISLVDDATGSAVIYNFGIIEASQSPASNVAILEVGGNTPEPGSTIINNSAQIIGDISVSNAIINNGAGADWEFAGTNTFAGGINVIDNAGTINSQGSAGIIQIAAGSLDIVGAIGGTVNLEVGNGATLELNGPASPGETVTFLGTQGTLQLDHSLTSPFIDQIANLASASSSVHDSIDLADLSFSSLSSAQYVASAPGSTSGTLTVSDGSGHTETFDLVNYTGAGVFTTASDGAAGTLVFDPPAAVVATDLATPEVVSTGAQLSPSSINGSVTFATASADGVASASFTADNGGAGYIGNFSVDPVVNSNGQPSVGWHFALDAAQSDQIMPSQVLSQSYEVALSNDQQAKAVTQEVTILTGGAGGDTFDFKPGMGTAIVTNFSEQAGDKIDLHQSAITNFAQLQAAVQSVHGEHDTVIELDHGDTLTLANVAISQLHANNFIFA